MEKQAGTQLPMRARTVEQQRESALWVNDERTLLVRKNPDGSVEAAERLHRDAVWGPPIQMKDAD